VYSLPVLKWLYENKKSPMLVRTSWPQIICQYLPSGSDVLFVPPKIKLRTQIKNVEKNRKMFVNNESVRGLKPIRLSYRIGQRQDTPLSTALKLSVRMRDEYYLRLQDPCNNRQNVAIVRPATLWTEWRAASRNCKQKYIEHAIAYLKSRGLEVWVVADIKEGVEDYDGFRPSGADCYFEKGELSLEELLTALWQARIVVGGVGFIAPVGIALGTPTVIVHGGAGGWNHPTKINCRGVGELVHVLPKRYCLCKSHKHNCDKTIDIKDLDIALEGALL